MSYVKITNTSIETPSIIQTTVFPRTGMIVAWAGITPPVGAFICNGDMISKTTYSSLFNVLGTAYGESGNSFKLPDFRNMFLMGQKQYTCNDITYGSWYISNIGHTHSIDMSQYYSEKLNTDAENEAGNEGGFDYFNNSVSRSATTRINYNDNDNTTISTDTSKIKQPYIPIYTCLNYVIYY